MPHHFHTEPAIEVRRGGLTESLHHAAVAVVRPDGTLLAWLGDPGLVTYMRSSAKPFQAIPVVESGAFDHFGFDERELALICASHSGQPMHTQLAQRMLDTIGMTVDDLRCGVHPPTHSPSAQALRASGHAPTAIHNNCSGKHSGMLALSKFLGAADRDYREVDHPVQQRNLAALADLAGVSVSSIHTAVDGCSVPTFALPLHAAARAFARLLDPAGLAPDRVQAIERIVPAMQAHPELVAGDDRFDTWLMSSIPGVVSKGGAEGYQGLAVRRGDDVYGVVTRVADGDVSGRAGPVLVVETLRQLGLLNDASPAFLDRWQRGAIRNRHGTAVGEVVPAFTLQRR